MEGLLLVDKPQGWTSFDVVKYIRNIASKSQNLAPKRIKAGHSGTLDPFATGLLIILLGKKYTSLASQFLQLDKTYLATLELGKVSDTGDTEGKISNIGGAKVPTEPELKAAIASFKGQIEQIPPAYSALKINGVRSYELARRGETIEHKPRAVTIYEIKLNKYNYPFAEIEATVSSGTYIRSLVADIGAELKSGAYTCQLRRTEVGSYSIDDALRPEDINEQIIADALITEVSPKLSD